MKLKKKCQPIAVVNLSFVGKKIMSELWMSVMS